MKKKLDSILVNVFTVIRDTYKKMGVGIEIIPRLIGDGKKFFVEKVLNFLGEEFLKQGAVKVKTVVKKITEFLRFISGGETLILDACDGTEVISSSDDMFEAGVDPDFIDWDADEKGPATGEIEVSVYELIKDANFTDMFGSLDADVDKLFFTQHQIKNFIRKYRKWLRVDGYATLFPYKSRGNRFVANVFVRSGGELGVRVYRFGNSSVWYAVDRRRVVVPQLA